MPTTVNDPRETAKGEFRLTGRHVLLILVGVFGFVAAVNAFMIWQAVGSFPGVVTESSYRDSQKFNTDIAAARDQATRGWQIDAQANRDPQGRAVIRLEAKDAQGKPITGVSFKATLQHPANRGLDHVVALGPVVGSDGVYQGIATGVAEGKWGMEVEGNTDKGRVFRSENSLFLR